MFIDSILFLFFFFSHLSFWQKNSNQKYLFRYFYALSPVVTSDRSYRKVLTDFHGAVKRCYSVLNWYIILLKLHCGFQSTWILCSVKIIHRKNKNQGFGTDSSKLHSCKSNCACIMWSFFLKKAICGNWLALDLQTSFASQNKQYLLQVLCTISTLWPLSDLTFCKSQLYTRLPRYS